MRVEVREARCPRRRPPARSPERWWRRAGARRPRERRRRSARASGSATSSRRKSRFTRSTVASSRGRIAPARRDHRAGRSPRHRRGGIELGDLDGIAVTAGPGLVGALLVGVETAKSLAYALGKPSGGREPPGRASGRCLSRRAQRRHAAAGGRRIPTWRCSFRRPHGDDSRRRSRRTALLGATRDDAAGEAFDKVGKMLGLGYPGGVASKAWQRPETRMRSRYRARSRAATTSTSASPASRPPCRRCCGGAVPEGQELPISRQLPGRGRRRAVPEVAPRDRAQGIPHLVVCGGVAANRGLRAGLAAAAAEDGFNLYIPPPKRCTDNAAMIAAAGTRLLARGDRAGLDLSVDPGLPLSSEPSKGSEPPHAA